MKPLLTSLYCENECDRSKEYDEHGDFFVTKSSKKSSIPESSYNINADDNIDWEAAVDEWWDSMSNTDD